MSNNQFIGSLPADFTNEKRRLASVAAMTGLLSNACFSAGTLQGLQVARLRGMVEGQGWARIAATVYLG